MKFFFGFYLSLSLAASLVAGLALDELPRRFDHSRLRQLNSDPFDDKAELLSSANIASPYHGTSKRKTKDEEYFPESRFFSKDERDDELDGENDLSWSAPVHSFRSQVKRSSRDSTTDKDNRELEDILKDDENESQKSRMHRDRKVPPDMKRRQREIHSKKKRQSPSAPTDLTKGESSASTKDGEDEEEEEHAEPRQPDFNEWIRKEYYRNMAKSFASMRRKRAGPPEIARQPRKERKAVEKRKSVQFEDVAENLRAMESALLWDAARAMEDEDEGNPQNRVRIDDDLSAAYDLETVRAALFRLRDTLRHRDKAVPLPPPPYHPSEQDFAIYKKYRKRGEKCPPLDVLTSDCSILGDIISDDNLKEVLTRACNWHEVCYSCGEVFDLSSESCDMGFIEQSQTICRGDVPCQSTASLLLLPLRQRRVFYKRSNPSVCLVDPCVEAFLTQG